MHLSLSPPEALAAARAIKMMLLFAAHSPVEKDDLTSALNALLDALESEAERQHLDRSYPEGGY
jgi:hypothetical protein